MEKQRKVKYLSLVVLIIAVLGLTVAFAAMSATLKINGTATLDAATWDVHFENLEYGAYGDGTLAGTPVMSGTSITGIDAVITKPGNTAGYTVEIVNDGTINAKIASVEISKLCTLQSSVEACDWDNDGKITQNDIDKVNNNISFVMFYSIGSDDELQSLKKGDILKAGQRKSIDINFEYYKDIEIDGKYPDNAEDSTELPKRDLKFNDLSIKINYVQAD